MSQFATTNPWILALIALLFGAMIGMLLTLLFERRKSGGRTVEDLQREMDDYKEEVGKHFATTSELFRDMTEKYRDVYNHLASGSQHLCEDAMEHARLEFAEAKPIEAASDGDTGDTGANEPKSGVEAAPDDTTGAQAEPARKPVEPPLGV